MRIFNAVTIAIAVSVIAFAPQAKASPGAAQTRKEALAAAQVWTKPPWMNDAFEFVQPLDVLKGPAKHGWETELEAKPVACHVRDEDLKRATHGMTNKFSCTLGSIPATTHARVRVPAHDRVGQKDHAVKFKCDFDDGEITSEILSTRLFWALGFGADRVYPVDELHCFGCTMDPFTDRRIDPTTLVNPRVFEHVAAERKFSKHYIGRGWTFEELMTTATKQNRVERDALRLLSVFVQHADNKAENQDLACDGRVNSDGGCSGPTFMLIQDLGATFGSGYLGHRHMSKAVFDDWKNKPLWAEPAKCIANLGMNAEGDMEEPEISEEGRAFLAKLLQGFSRGPEGRKRVEDLFRAGHAEWRGGTIDEWTDVFLKKVDVLSQPCSAKAP